MVLGKVLSISIAAYNVERYLENTLSSLCVPGVIDDIEVLIVNDGSKDSTAKIAKKYCERYPNSFFLLNKENGGYGSTINASLKVATGKYYKLLDGDDWFDSENLSSFIKELRSSVADIIYTNYTSFQEPFMFETIEVFPWSPNVLFRVEDVNVLSMHGIAVKTALLQNKGVLITEHCFYTDVEFTLKALSLGVTVEYIPMNIYCYRLGVEGQSVSLKGMLKHIDDHENISKLALGMVYGCPNLEKVKPTIQFMAQRHVNLLILLGDYNRFTNYVSFLREKYPDVKTWEKGYQRFVSAFPRLFFNPISKMKRRRNNI